MEELHTDYFVFDSVIGLLPTLVQCFARGRMSIPILNCLKKLMTVSHISKDKVSVKVSTRHLWNPTSEPVKKDYKIKGSTLMQLPPIIDKFK